MTERLILSEQNTGNGVTDPVSTDLLAYREFETPSLCPVCESSHLAPAFPPDMSRCLSCKVYFRSPRPTQNEIRRFYNCGTSYRSWTTEEDIRRQLWRKRMQLIQRHAPPGRLLDISTGDAHFLQVARDAGFEVTGTEFSEHAADLCRKRGFDVHVGAFEGLPDSCPFDVITLWHVLEHLPHPGQALLRIGRLLGPGGICVIAVPNEDHSLFFPPKSARANPFGELLWGHEVHLVYFQLATLRQALLRSGFEILECGVDDVEILPDWKTKVAHVYQQSLYRLCGWHYSKAMYFIARKPF